ncbi:hypothetical protein JRQ81_015780 [Phrynocephalus forsythii]|uniref:Zinc finger and BTB domain-containing protein 49 n=1 Tax=Phrynocephalus forsythii TaxID=171643 RepID=A0A9Q0XV81_9SAUR|nr:hypothetical protein JRQ81_015780 [Phrynocephalus forsythii]
MDAFASHSCHLLQQLHDQRIQGLLCDCMLVVRSVCFKAHKNVLAAFSQYFRSLFQNSPSRKNDIFHLDIKNVSGIGQILDYMYTSHLDLNQDNVQTLLDIAQCLQVQNVLNMCRSFLKSSGDLEQQDIMPCNGIPSLQSSLATNDNCPDDATNLLRVSSSSEDPCPVSDDHGLQRSQPAEFHISSDTLNRLKQDSLSDSSTDPDISFKQSDCNHRRHNFYGKHFYKKAACSSSKRLPKLSSDFSVSAKENSISQSGCLSEPSHGLKPAVVVQPLSECPGDQGLEDESLQSSKQLRLKKTVHLKKLDFLQSQKSLEQSTVHKIADGDITRKIELEVQKSTERINNGTNEQKEVKNLVSLERLEQNVELMPSQKSSDPASQLQTLLPERQYPCAVCGKAFKHPSNLELHIRSHTGEKPFECNICGKCFSQAGNLQTHLRRHSGEKPYICEICGKRFAASGDVQRHIIIHTGEKPHLCDICGRGFSNFSNLKEHKKNHIVEKVFTCDQCGKSFNLLRKLVKHRIRHTGERPYSCSACGKCFGGSGDLRRHIQTHTGEKPYNCETCNKCFSRSAVLRRHQKIHCKADNEARNILGEFSQSMGIANLEKSQSSDSFTQEIPTVNLLPISANCPIYTAGNSSDELQSPGRTFQKVEPSGKHRNCVNQPKISLDPIKCCKSQQTCSYKEMDLTLEEQPLPSDDIPMAHSGSNGELSCHISSAECRNNEGPFFSSVGLWGLAMKTLQNEDELNQ